jgi:hypothetical protein
MVIVRKLFDPNKTPQLALDLGCTDDTILRFSNRNHKFSNSEDQYETM